MEKKKSKKSWRKHQKQYCFCFHCTGDYLSRLFSRTRIRKKFSKYHEKNLEE
jgi:hypothetical protein